MAEATEFIDVVSSKMEPYVHRILTIPSSYGMIRYKCMPKIDMYLIEKRGFH
jgi:hypothetical protein